MGHTLSQIPAFLWNVLLHWQSLVTGGLITAIFAGYQGLTKREIKKRTYFWVFIVAAFVCSCFLAWHDEHENTELVIVEKARFSGLANNCSSELTATRAVLQGKEELATSLQSTLTNLQAPQLQQQATINSCVVALGKMNPTVNAKVTTLSMLVTKSMQPDRFGIPETHYLYEIVILTNHTRDPRGVIKCDSPFNVIGSPSLHTQASMTMIASGPPAKISDREYRIWVQNTGAEWDSENPILPAVSDSEKLMGCEFIPEK